MHHVFSAEAFFLLRLEGFGYTKLFPGTAVTVHVFQQRTWRFMWSNLPPWSLFVFGPFFDLDSQWSVRTEWFADHWRGLCCVFFLLLTVTRQY